MVLKYKNTTIFESDSIEEVEAFNKAVSYHTLIRMEVQKIFKAIVYGEKYKPYKYL